VRHRTSLESVDAEDNMNTGRGRHGHRRGCQGRRVLHASVDADADADADAEDDIDADADAEVDANANADVGGF
jgi:hypothetical protein